MYNTIVVGTDGSETAGTALAHAVALAKSFDGMLHIVHAYRTVSASDVVSAATAGTAMPDFASVNEGIKATSEHVLEHGVAAADREGVKAQGHAVPGDAADALINVAEQVHADVIVVGNRGMAGLRRFLLGSVPNKVAHQCPCSILIVNTAADA